MKSELVRGVLLGFLAYGLLASGDGVKGLGPDRFSVFEIGFWFSLFALGATYFMRPQNERWRDMFRMPARVLVLLRCSSGLTAGFLVRIPFVFSFFPKPMR